MRRGRILPLVELLERESFLGALAGYADEALQGHGRVVLIAGEAGVGKTAFLEAFRARLSDATWAWGACDGLSTPRPLAPLHDMAGELGDRMLAAIRDGVAREDLFDAALSALREGDATVLVIEDLHWADEATLDLLRFLARRVHELPALLLVTYRDDALGSDPMLRAALGDLSSYRATRRMGLPPLSAEGVARLARGSAYPRRDLHRLTGGNPYFVTEVLAAGCEDVPPSVRDVVLARADRLDADARRALDVAALLGAKPETLVLRAVEGLRPEGLDACVEAGILLGQPGAVVFRHDLARLALVAAVPPGRRVELHRSILRSLRACGVKDDARLAYHADEGHDGPSTLEFARAAASAAATVGSHREAAAQYARALRHAGGLPPRERAELLESLAAEAALFDDWEPTVQTREAALAIWRELGDDLRAGEALRLLVAPYWRLCRGPDSRRASEEAAAILEPLGHTRELAAAWVSLAGTHHHEGRYDESLELAGRAADLARELGQLDIRSGALNIQACTLLALDQDPAELTHACLAAAVEGDHPAHIGMAYANGCETFSVLWRLDQADRFYRNGISYTDARELFTWGSCLRGVRTWSLRQQGRLREAAELAELLLARGLPSPVNSVHPLSSAGVLAARAGRREAAWLPLDEALGYALELGEPHYLLPVRLARAEVRWLEGSVSLAAQEISELLGVFDVPDSRQLGEALTWAKRVGLDPAPFLRESWPTPTLPWVQELAGEHRRAADGWDGLGAHWVAAMALASSDDEQDLRDALTRFRAMEAPAAEASVRQRLRERGADAVPVGPRASTRAHPGGLTRRETEVLNGLVRGLTNAALAAELFLSERTVERHVSNVLGKLGVSTRAEAARVARERGLLVTT